MKINFTNTLSHRNRLEKKTALNTEKGPFEEVIIGSNRPDESFLPGDKLKNIKFSPHDTGITKGEALKTAMTFAGAGFIGYIGYEAGSMAGGPLTALALTAAGAFIGGMAVQNVADAL